MAMTIRVPAPRMALDNGGAAIATRELDVWAGSNNLIETFDWRMHVSSEALSGGSGAS